MSEETEITEEELQSEIDWYFDNAIKRRGIYGKKKPTDYLRGYRAGFMRGRRIWEREQKEKKNGQD